MKKGIHIILGLLFVAMEAAAGDTVSIHTDFIYISGKKIGQDIFYTLSADAKMSVKLECYRYVAGQDSVLIARTMAPDRKFRKGTGRMQLLYNGSEYKGYLQSSFAQTLKQTGIIPPGSYKVFVSVGNDRIKAERTFLREIDSLLPPQSSLRGDMHSLLLSGSKNMSPRKRDPSSSDHAGRVFRRSRRQMERHFRRKGINMMYRSQEGKEIADLYYGGWFLGRYEMDSKSSVSSQIAKEQRDLSSVTGSVTGNELGNYQSLFSQFRELKKGRRENEEMEGELSWSSVAGNDQEAYSQTENTYHELRGQVMMPVLGLPVSFEGFYTTQDRNREAKAGYMRMRYDASRSKEKLLQLINGYKQQYANTDAKGGSYRMIYGQFLVQARAQQATAIDRLKRESGIAMPDGSAPDLDMLKKRAGEQARDEGDKLQDSSGYKDTQAGAALKSKEKAEAVKQETEARYRRWEEQYRNIRSLEEKIERYRILLDQYQHTLRYDSLLAYDKVKELEHADEMSYKDLSKKAGSILPEGKAGRFLTGITTIDLGMFPKYVSDYTLSGQRMTGADMGYDAGIA